MSAGKDRSLYFSQEGERLARRLAAILKADYPTVARSHTDAEWHQCVRAALGPAFAWVEDHQTTEPAETILRMVRQATWPVPSRETSDICVGARLLSGPPIDSIILGPVRFETREVWLQRRFSKGNLSITTATRITQRWSGKVIRKRKTSVHTMNERDILDVVGDFPHVCSVTSVGLAPAAQRTKSLTVARLALTAISLLWESPSYCLERILLKTDAGVRHLQALRVTDGRLSLADRWLADFPQGPHVEANEWRRLVATFSDVWDVCGKIFEHYLAAEPHTKKPTVATALLHALIWFYEGCRQELDSIAVVHFSACLDALANGEDKDGIRRLITARLGYNDDDPVFRDGSAMRKVVDEIYSDGRSRIIHGTNVNLRSDWRGVRERSEKLARMCLISCLRWGSSNSLDSSPKALQEIPHRGISVSVDG